MALTSLPSPLPPPTHPPTTHVPPPPSPPLDSNPALPSPLPPHYVKLPFGLPSHILPAFTHTHTSAIGNHVPVHSQVLLARGLKAIGFKYPHLAVGEAAADGILERLASQRLLLIEASVSASPRSPSFVAELVAAHEGPAPDAAPAFTAKVHQTLLSGATAHHRDTYCAGAPQDIETVWEVALGEPTDLELQPSGTKQPLPHGSLAFPVYGVAKLSGAVGGGGVSAASVAETSPPSLAADGDLSFHVCIGPLSPLSYHGSPGPGEL